MEVSDLLEPCALSGASTVLRRQRVSNDPLLSDNAEKVLAKYGRKWYDCWQIQLLKEAVMMAAKLSQEWNRTIHRIGRE